MESRPRLIVVASLLSLLMLLLAAFPPRQFAVAAQPVSEPRHVPHATQSCMPPTIPSALRLFLPMIRSGGQATNSTNRPPIAGLCALILPPNTTATLDLGTAASDPDGDTLSWSLDGTPAHGIAALNGAILTYTPAAGYSGPDTVAYTLSDGRGGTTTGSVTITVKPADPTDNQPPTVTLEATVLAGIFPLSVDFTATASDANGDALAYAWDFGDGTEGGNQATLTHVYSRTGLFEARVSVRDATSRGSDAVEVRVSSRPGDPPDPIDSAPPIDPTVPTSVISSTEFIYTGPSPVQTGVAPGTIDPERAAVVRGRVITRDGAPLAGVTIAVLDHPEYGQTLSRGDGYFDLVVNGAELTITYRKDGFLQSQRKADPAWGGWAYVDDVALIVLDPVVTAVDPASADPAKRTAQGSIITDNDGTRRATLLFPQGVTATMTVNGQPVPLTTLHVRATEYTVGPNGPEAMPGELPPQSGYTYAVELSADEAIAAGATEVRFSKPVPFYLENFLHFPVGSIVPAGYYDRARGEWLADLNGRVIKVLAAGAAPTLDIDGDGIADGLDKLAALGITADELARVGRLYPAGAILWRVPLTHFTPWDCNWPFGPPPGAKPPNPPKPPKDPKDPKNPKDPCKEKGSVIKCESQVLGEMVAVSGTPYWLHYESDRVPGRADRRSLTIPLSGATLPPDVRRILLEIEVAGQRLTRDFPPTLNQDYTYVWNGRDGFGRLIYGLQKVKGRVGYVYDAVYQDPGDPTRAFAAYSGIPITADPARQQITLWQDFETRIGAWDARTPGLGGWSLDVQHAYDPATGTLYSGDGQSRNVGSVDATITTVAGTGIADPPFGGDGGPALEATLQLSSEFAGMDVGPDGSIYIADGNNDRVRRIDRDGIITTVVGNGSHEACFAPPTSYSGQATETSICQPLDVAVAPDGTLYVIASTVNQSHILKVTPDKTISLLAKRDLTRQCAGADGGRGDGGPVAGASICIPRSLAVGPDGSLYIADTGNYRVRRIDTNGIITTIAGDGADCFTFGILCGEGGPARAARLGNPYGIAVGPDGSVYVTLLTGLTGGAGIRRIWPDGHITTVALTAIGAYSGDGGPVDEARLSFGPQGIVVAADGTIYVADANNDVVRQISTDGIITALAGTYYGGYARHGSVGRFGGDEGPATRAYLTYPGDLAIAPDGTLLVADVFNDRIRQVRPALPSLSGPGSLIVPSEDGAEAYIFNSVGRHQQTVDGRTGAVRYTFGYDGSNHLSTITDGDSLRTTIAHDPAGNPTSISGPYGQRTTLKVDANGFLKTITAPDTTTTTLTSNLDGLLLALRDPRGNTHHYGYDDVGRLVRDENPAGGVTTLSHTETLSSTTVVVTDPVGRATTYGVTLLASGDTTRTTIAPGGARTEARIGSDGITSVTYPDGSRLTQVLGPDPRWGMLAPLTQRMIVATTAGLTTTLETMRSATLATPGNPVVPKVLTETILLDSRPFTSVLTAGAGGTWTETATTPEGRRRTTLLDARGRVISTQLDPTLAPITIGYDARGRVSRVAQGDQSSTYTYDALGQVASVQDASGHQAAYTRDTAGRPTGVTLPGNRTYALAYDANGNLASITAPGGSQHTLTHSALDLLSGYAAPGNPAYGIIYDAASGRLSNTQPGGRTITWRTDAAGRPTGPQYTEATSTFEYAGMTGHVSSITRDAVAGSDQRIDQSYDSFLQTGMRFSGAAEGDFAYTYGRELLLSSVTLTSGGATTSRAFTRDADGLLTGDGSFNWTRSGPGGAVSAIGDGTLALGFSYDTLARPTRRQHTVAGQATYDGGLTFDTAGRLVRKVEALAGTSHTYDYAYDPAGQLTEVRRDSVVVERYGYDASGNRTSRTLGSTAAEMATYDGQDRLLTRGATAYTFDADGFLTQRGADSFTYSARGELLSATVGAQTSTYAYDGYGRRVAQTTATGTTQYLYGNPENMLQVTATRDPAGILSTYYYDAQGSLYALERAGSRFYIATDQLGTPLVVSSTTGVAVKVLQYDSWGAMTADSAPAFELALGYAGGLRDGVTGLVRFGFRDYEPASGRWTARDPLLFAGGQINLYAYTGNSPIAFRDAAGLASAGFSAYDGVGGGLKVVLGPNGFSVCAEAGVGLGGGLELNPLEDAKDSFGLKDEINLQLGPAGVGFGGKLDIICDKVTFYGKAKLGPLGVDTDKGTGYKANPSDIAGGKNAGDIAASTKGFKFQGKLAIEGCAKLASW